MAALLEYIPLIVFFIVYKMVDVFAATGALIVATAVQLIIFKLIKKPIAKHHLYLFALVTVMGGLTIFFNNDAFIKWKVTVIYTFFGSALLISNHVFGKNLIKSFLGEQIKLPDNIWTKFNLAWAIMFISCAIINLYVAYNYDLDTWVNFKVIWLTVITFVFAIASILAIYKYIPQEEVEEMNAKLEANKQNKEK